MQAMRMDPQGSFSFFFFLNFLLHVLSVTMTSWDPLSDNNSIDRQYSARGKQIDFDHNLGILVGKGFFNHKPFSYYFF